MITASQTGQIISHAYEIIYQMETEHYFEHTAYHAERDEHFTVFRSGDQFYITVWVDGAYVASAVKFEDIEAVLVAQQPLYQNAIA